MDAGEDARARGAAWVSAAGGAAKLFHSPWHRVQSASPDENAADDWRVESDGLGELLVFCPECWQREFVPVTDGVPTT